MDGHLREHLAVQGASGFDEPAHQLAIRKPVDFGAYADTIDPKASIVSFLLFAAAIVECHRLEDAVRSEASMVFAVSHKTFCLFEQSLAFAIAVDGIGCSRHVTLPLNVYTF